MTSPARRSVRTLLVRLVLACLLPGFIGASALFIYEYQEGRSQLERDTIQTARALAQAVDNQILRVQALAQGLAAADALARGDFAVFYQQARQTLAQSRLAATLVLADQAGQQTLNSLKAYGETLPRHGNPELLRQVFKSGQPVISDLYVGTVLQRPLMAVGVPVFVDGKVSHALVVGILPEQFKAILVSQGLPAGWVATIFDRRGTLVASSAADDREVKKPPEDYVKKLMTSDEGAFEEVRPNGLASREAYARSPVTHWRVAISIPEDVLRAQLTRRLFALAIGITMLFATGLGVAWLMSDKIARSFQALIKPAVALGSGGQLDFAPLEVEEAIDVAQALNDAARLLQERNAALHQATQTLRFSEEVLRVTFDQAAVGIAHVGADAHFLRANQKFCGMLGYTEAQLQQKTFMDLTCEADRKAGLLEFERSIANQIHEFAQDKRYIRRDGSILWVRLTVSSVRDSATGAFRFNVAIIEDITDRKRTEQQLIDSEARLRSTFEQVTVGLAHVSLEGRFQRVNAHFANTVGYERNALKGMTFQEITHPDDLAEDLANIERCLSGEIPGYTMEKRYVRQDGACVWCNLTASLVRDAYGKPDYFVSVVENIQARKEAERALAEEREARQRQLSLQVDERTAEVAQSNEALMRSNMELRHFAHAAAHDLQTPLRSIAGFAHLLEQTATAKLAGSEKEWLRMIIDNTKRLQILIQELLIYARMDAEARPLECTDLGELCKEVRASLAASISEAQAEVHCEGLPTLMVDRVQFAQLLQNLIDNGIKYRSKNPPEIRISCRRQANDWIFSVADNGVGIDPQYQQRIFDIFRRLHTYDEIPGSGIGLAICQRVVERHGGRIWVESRPGEGSTFYFNLPDRRAPIS